MIPRICFRFGDYKIFGLKVKTVSYLRTITYYYVYNSITKLKMKKYTEGKENVMSCHDTLMSNNLT